MKIRQVVLRKMKMKLKTPFATSFGAFEHKQFILVEVQNEDGLSGWGEASAFDSPWYTEETVKTSWHMLEDFLIPALLGKELQHPAEVAEIYSAIRRNNMAKAGIEGAVWDLYAKEEKRPLSDCLGGEKKKIEVGISIGIQKSMPALFERIDKALAAGYKRIKLKIKPGHDVEVLKEVRRAYPSLPVMADANSAYTLKDHRRLKELDQFDLMMIEQPLGHDDIIDHARLQPLLRTPICLDESITSFEDVRKAIEIGACRIINVKVGRVGGLSEAVRIHDLCLDKGIPVWCGGMLESGVGRAHNIALTALPGFTMPGDTAASANYWAKDIIEPEVTMENGFISVPDGEGIGYEVDLKAVDEYTEYSRVFRV